MPLTYTNRKGVTYTLCRTTTKTGKGRYVFVRDPADRETVEEIPEGWEIRESVNGVVSLAQAREQQLRPEEIAAVKAALNAHPKAHNYRLDVKPERLLIYERVGPDAEALLKAVSADGSVEVPPDLQQRLHDEVERYGRFTPILRFILNDAETRDFRAERWCFRHHIDDRIFVDSGELTDLAETLIPTLGTDTFFDL
ncbi:MAG: hypothetical protein ACP5HM_15805 [Anaerolineae bacterium]